MTTVNVICARCRHFRVSEKKYNKCLAFPDDPGIPWIIISGKNNHKKPLPGQKNIFVFEEKN